MANTVLQKKNGHYLWFSLLGLGFQPNAASKTNIKHLNLGPNMFDKPNKDAFYMVTHFLLEKLNPTRFQDAYRHCWPVLNHKADAEFRKVTCTWLREIMDQTANAGSRVVASLFLSPGGPKFISLMLHLANHVMLQEMKMFTTSDSWVPQAAAMPTSSSDMAVKRFSLIRTRFVKAAVDQDRFLHEYQRRAQHLVKSMRDIKAEGAKYDELLTRFSDPTQDEASYSEKIQKVRDLWSDIEGMRSAIGEEQNAVESVLKGDVDQYVLDGTDRVLHMPRCLLERIEQLPHQLNSGNVYEDGQLNLLCVMELLNHSLELLKEERCRISPSSDHQLGPQNLQEKRREISRVLQDLQLIRKKLCKEEIPQVRSSVRALEADWDKRWTETLKETPLVSFLSEDPALGFLSPMAPLSFEPAAEATYRNGVFSQYPAKLPDVKPAENESEDVANAITSFPSNAAESEAPDVAADRMRGNTSLDWLFDTPPSPPRKAPPLPTIQVSVKKTSHEKIPSLKTKTQILDLEYENLADQFADAVTTVSPSEGRVRGLDLESLLSTYQRDPFSARKQLPRTPESLIKDVKSSWRKAVEEDESINMSQSAMLNDILPGWSVPPSQSQNTGSHAAPQTAAPDLDSHSAHQQGVPLKSSLLWDTFNTEGLDSPSGTGSSAVQFSLEHETLPELPSCDSLSFEDEAVDMQSEEEEEILIPSLKLKRSLLATPGRDQNQFVSCDVSLRTAESLLSDNRDKDWLMEPGASAENTNKVFSLDLDSLETLSPAKNQQYSLPKLITFSPIDDMKR